MALDPQIETVLQLVKQANAPEMWQLTPDQAREQYKLRVDKLSAREPIHRSENRRIDGKAGPLAIRIFYPRDNHPGERLPLLVWYHGGGFVIGDLDSHDSACRMLANAADCIVVAVDYRLAPEYKFPAAVEDSETALQWVARHAAEFGGDPARIAVGGDSAGANLATVVAILARNAAHPKLVFQLLIYPCTAPEPESPSHKQFAEGYILTRKTMTWFYQQYRRSSRDQTDFRFAPLVADDLTNLPPALVLVAGYDPLRDEGIQYAQRLIEAGNRVRLSNYEGVIHGFYLMAGAVDAARQAMAESADMLRAAFGRSEQQTLGRRNEKTAG